MAWNVEASQLDDQRHLAYALAILLTVGARRHRASGDDAVRPAFPDAPDQLAPSAGASTGCTSG